MVGTQLRAGPLVAKTQIQIRTKVELMNRSGLRYRIAIVIAMVGIGLAGCNPMTSSRHGRGVMFESPPRISSQDVYCNGRAIGKILDQKTGKGSVCKVTVQLSSEHTGKADSNWVFYVDDGRLNAYRIAPFGHPQDQGENLCGFSSKAALNWFRFKTLLTDRIYKARQIADARTRRFG
jgi:hypothetical protein